VLKFLQFYLGTHYTLSENDQFGAYLYSQMRRPMQDARRDHVLESYQGKWQVHFGSLSPKKHGLRLTGKGVQRFDDFVNRILEVEMIGYVSLAVRFGNKIKYAILEYMAERSILEEDIPYETLYKRYQRDSQERQVAKKLAALRGPVRSDKEVRKQLLRVPLPAPVAGRLSA
jgi:hypothetical protein